MEKREAEVETEVKEEARIFVGGLGEKVTDDDLSKIFTSLGEVKGVDIVRTKGRSFGYVDFFPSSHKSLSKLFSTYYGCVWKGGRLKLEKAKEHYLSRFQREWTEEDAQAQLLSCPVEADDENVDVMLPKDMPMFKKVIDKEKRLSIFFPRLRKMKTLPFSGTGKHKYSFQQVEARQMPVYFCDCEEHSANFPAAEGRQIHRPSAGEGKTHDMEALDGGGVINEEELSLMNSVMNRLFERGNVSNAGGTGLVKDEHNSDKVSGDLQIEENEVDTVADEDNLVINVLSSRNNRMALSRCQEKKLAINGAQTSEDRPAQSVPKEQKKNNLPQNKKRNSPDNDVTVMATDPVDDVKSQTNTIKLRTAMATERAGLKSRVRKSTASHSWSQKMSWKALIGDKDSRAFSVSNILPSDASIEEADNEINSIEELKFDENESDDDNLIINAVSKKKPRMALSRRQNPETTSTMNNKSVSEEINSIEDRSIQQRKSPPPPKKKRKSITDEECNKINPLLTVLQSAVSMQTHTEMQMPAGVQPVESESGVKQSISDHSESKMSLQRVHVGEESNNESSISTVLPDNSSKEEEPVSDIPDLPPGSTDSIILNSSAVNEHLEGKSVDTVAPELLFEAQPSQSNTAPNKSGKGSSWFQKSPWTQLINENNSSFSITQISPSISFKKHEVSKTEAGKEFPNPDNKSGKSVVQVTSEPTTRGLTALDDGKEREVASQSIPEKSQPTIMGSNDVSPSMVSGKYDWTPRRTTEVDFSIGETCSFMRSATSIKEWSKAKATLSGSQSHKRKSHDKK